MFGVAMCWARRSLGSRGILTALRSHAASADCAHAAAANALLPPLLAGGTLAKPWSARISSTCTPASQPPAAPSPAATPARAAAQPDGASLLPPAVCQPGNEGEAQHLPPVQLVRDFIHDSLYHPTEGYFSRQSATGAAVVGYLPAPLDFRSMPGQTEYLLAVQAQYRALQASWLTPVEIFQPHYGRAIANCILQRWQQWGHAAAAAAVAGAGEAEAGQRGEPPALRIFEIGGGTGTLARNVLDWLRDEHPAAYQRCRYTCIEISPVLAALQTRRVAHEAGHGARFAVRRHDAADAAAWAAADAEEAAAAWAEAGGCDAAGQQQQEQRRQQEACFIVMCEVLDNLPHDRVWRQAGSQEWQQTLVAAGDPLCRPEDWHLHHSDAAGGTQARLFELLAPVSDSLIARCLQALEDTTGEAAGGRSGGAGTLGAAAARLWRRALGEAAAEVRWLPTGCLHLLDTLHRVRPAHTLVAADFDQLPEVAVAGVNAPLVATTAGGTTVDHGSYLVPRGSADIFFPTDFALLCTLYRQAAAAAAAAASDQQAGSPAGSTHTRAAPALPAATAEAGAAAATHGSCKGSASAEYTSTGEFMRAHCPDPSATATASGYNPLLQDYSNTAFFVGSTA